MKDHMSDNMEKTKATKAEKKAAKLAAKAAAKAEKAANSNSCDAMNDEQYRLWNLEKIQNAKAAGNNPYPHKFDVTLGHDECIRRFSEIDPGTHLDNNFRMAGRVTLKRGAGKLVFYTFVSNQKELQIMANCSIWNNIEIIDGKPTDESLSAFKALHGSISRGDIIGVEGFIGKSKKGELSIFAKDITVLASCVRTLPKHSGLKDTETRFRDRCLDMIANPEVVQTLRKRSQLISAIRSWYISNEFDEVETPILWPSTGGATAKPFVSHYNSIGSDVFMRIAPELFLKQLVIGGMDRVFEIGKQFRNEGMDTTHNPEFTSLESYKAYADYNDLMEDCESLLSTVVNQVNGSLQLRFLPLGATEEVIIDFTPPYKRIDMISTLEEATGTKFPDDLFTEETRLFFVELCQKNGVEVTAPLTTARLIDGLVGHYIEPNCIQPTFIINHPRVMSTLAKYHRENSNLSERFELFVCGKELANAYTELNDPVDQAEQFSKQKKDRDMGDQEVQAPDDYFVQALEYGLPPTGGFGMGIDRLAMLITNKNAIREVLTFPIMAPKATVEDN